MRTRSNGFSPPSLLPNETLPLNEPSVAVDKPTVKFAVAPGVKTWPEVKLGDSRLNPLPVTEIGSNVRSAVPVFSTVKDQAVFLHARTLQPGDEVRLFCGETWRADPLIVTRSGSPGLPIVFSSHPADCANRPVLSGARPISGWSLDAGNVYRADLSAGANAGLFPNGLNQLFRAGDPVDRAAEAFDAVARVGQEAHGSG